MALLEIEKDIEVVGRARDGREALDLCFKLMPDVLVTDIEMPEMTGIELAAQVKKTLPRTHVVILTTFARAGYLRRALRRELRGICSRMLPPRGWAMRCVASTPGFGSSTPNWPRKPGAIPICSPIANARCCAAPKKARPARTSPASRRLSEGTVRNYLSEAISKLGVANRIEAARLARQKGWL